MNCRATEGTAMEIDGKREGELAIDAPTAADAHVTFIGTIATPWASRSDCPRQGDREAGPVCRIVVRDIWLPALDGIDEHEDLQLLYWMHEARRDLVRLVPRGGRPRGPFALRAPTRPNPIALSIVTLLGRKGVILEVRGLDCVNGTPLLDIKPVRPQPHGCSSVVDARQPCCR